MADTIRDQAAARRWPADRSGLAEGAAQRDQPDSAPVT
jgi:hypothetical protein